MRAFRISLVLFAALLTLIAISTAYGLRVCRVMQDTLMALPDDPSEQAVAACGGLRDYWQAQTRFLRPLVNRTVIRTMSDLLIELTLYAEDGESAADYRATREKVMGAIDEMRRSEKATFGLWS